MSKLSDDEEIENWVVVSTPNPPSSPTLPPTTVKTDTSVEEGERGYCPPRKYRWGATDQTSNSMNDSPYADQEPSKTGQSGHIKQMGNLLKGEEGLWGEGPRGYFADAPLQETGTLPSWQSTASVQEGTATHGFAPVDVFGSFAPKAPDHWDGPTTEPDEKIGTTVELTPYKVQDMDESKVECGTPKETSHEGNHDDKDARPRSVISLNENPAAVDVQTRQDGAVLVAEDGFSWQPPEPQVVYDTAESGKDFILIAAPRAQDEEDVSGTRPDVQEAPTSASARPPHEQSLSPSSVVEYGARRRELPSEKEYLTIEGLIEKLHALSAQFSCHKRSTDAVVEHLLSHHRHLAAEVPDKITDLANSSYAIATENWTAEEEIKPDIDELQQTISLQERRADDFEKAITALGDKMAQFSDQVKKRSRMSIGDLAQRILSGADVQTRVSDVKNMLGIGPNHVPRPESLENKDFEQMRKTPLSFRPREHPEISGGGSSQCSENEGSADDGFSTAWPYAAASVASKAWTGEELAHSGAGKEALQDIGDAEEQDGVEKAVPYPYNTSHPDTSFVGTFKNPRALQQEFQAAGTTNYRMPSPPPQGYWMGPGITF